MAAPRPFRRVLPPACFARGELKNVLAPRVTEGRLFPPAKHWIFATPADEFHSERQRILANRGRKLVNKTFHDEAAAGVFDGTPPGAGHTRFGERVLDAEIRCEVRNGGPRAELAQPRILRAFLAPLCGDGG